MNLKSKFSKMKSFLFDEEDDEKKSALKKPIKETAKETAKEKEELSKTSEIEELYFEDISEKNVNEDNKEEVKSRVLKNEVEFNFPEFDDTDFMIPEKKEVKPPIVTEEPPRVLYQGSKRKEDAKKFRPTPMISPVYGLLDEDGNTANTDSSSADSKLSKDEISYDELRKKAYGSYDSLENTITRLSKKTIEEAEKDMEEEEKHPKDEEKQADKVREEKATVIEDDDDDMILPNVNFKEIDVDLEKDKAEKSEEDKQIPPDDDDDDDTKEQDLFNLIDSMYQKEGEE